MDDAAEILKMVDPELAPVLDLLPALGALNHETLAETREMLSGVSGPSPDVPGVTTRPVVVPGLAGQPDVHGVLYDPESAPRPRAALLYMHGGGYVAGSVLRDDAGVRSLAADTGCVFLSIDYRLAPETRYPGALEDCYAGLAWLHHNANAIGVDPTRIGVRGNSAGGGLAAGLALLARDRGEFPIAYQQLLYPMIDDRTAPHAFRGRHVWSAQSNLFAWTCLLGRAPGGDDIPEYAAPARARTLTGLPPTFISVGGLDLFVDENLDYARRLMDAGVATELHVYPGAFHGFNLIRVATIARDCERDLREAIKRNLSAS